MKTITVTDKDYETLMELSKELQTQTNNYQAAPYFWEPSSYKQEVNIHGEGEEVLVYYDCDEYTLQDFAENYEELYGIFLRYANLWDEAQSAESNLLYTKDTEDAWKDYIERHIFGATIWTVDWKQTHDHNPSLFLSDVENYIKCNKHHLGRKPRTYSRTIWRMPKMEQLVQCLLRLNTEVEETEMNHEALRFSRVVR